ncbi:MAG: hypothetical protein ING77_04440 [Rhodocyclaceae bacterium]|nr:hypothetical protein [Rhodocyclaceae bacterium]MCE2980147.1 hypothetical protein [Betaproteobacteria bacterium]MCA3073180.1 hypothetical protein [Rhodocyclaceae bacterium]MCA3090598.1 hypothetical protein [Rhodocyclaceae bacterium]MCA3094824.1 hypothetical protein [Rhodocyclaceae bacterium]
MSTAGRSPYTLATLLLAIVTVAVCALGWYTYRIAEDGRVAADRQQRALEEARLRYQRSGEERDLLTRYAPEYRLLESHGFIGAEQRVNWIDSLRMASESVRLPGVQYQIGAQAPYRLPEMPDAPLAQSPMTIELRLAHEGDLMRFLRALAAGRAGVFLLNECTLERLAAEPVGGGQPNLRADCELSWVSVPRPAGAAR